ncbi:actin [Plasmodium gonderi]|uniref:Actin n=1 Tax=Plasmodium gonderi TaxID=77519 RepID=A0A1Y1JSR3_PLAGO|nr:actin [Plasmodium gonderi]GAW82994.1 actin [Plasmodium gonderi]
MKNDVNESILCGGEDISALVVDLGFSTAKIGHNQEDTPRVFLKSICGEDVSAEEWNSTSEMNEIENGRNGNMMMKRRSPKEKLRFPLNLYNPSEHVRIKPLFQKDEVTMRSHLNSDVFEKLLEYAIEGIDAKRVFECTDEITNPMKLGGLNLKMNEHPILLSESNIHNDKIRKEMTEILFEKYNIPALYFAKKAKLTSFSLGRCNALVVDIGYSALDINPVYEGYVLQKNSFQFNIGGNYFDHLIYNLLKKDNVKVVPYFMNHQRYTNITTTPDICNNNIHLGTFSQQNKCAYSKIHPSYAEEAILDVISYMKETVCKVRVGQDEHVNKKSENGLESVTGSHKNCKDIQYNTNQLNNSTRNTNPSKWQIGLEKDEEEHFELPDGIKLKVDSKYKYDIAEHLFQPLSSDNNFKGLPDAIVNCIISSDVDIRKDLLQAIIITGGSSLFPGLIERLFNSLKEKECFSQSIKMKILNMTSSVESLSSSWLGGSILASLGTFQQLWVSRSEYDDGGHGLVFDRCF